MILNDDGLVQAIEAGRLTVQPILDEKRVQPASIDLTLGEEFAYWPTDGKLIDLGDPRTVPEMTRGRYRAGYPLHPGAFALAATAEVIGLAADLCARVEGRSSLGRLGLCIHATAGFIDPGFKGAITLELFNMSGHTLLLVPGMSICQLAVQQMSAPSARPYGSERGSKYMNQEGATPTRWRGSASE
jgi:dCTP deaminase